MSGFPAIEESTAGVAVVRLISCSSGFALTVSGLPTVSPIVDPSNDPLTCSLLLPGILLSSLVGFLWTIDVV